MHLLWRHACCILSFLFHALSFHKHSSQVKIAQHCYQQFTAARVQGIVTSQQAAEALAEPELQASDLVPRKYEGVHPVGGCISKHMLHVAVRAAAHKQAVHSICSSAYRIE